MIKTQNKILTIKKIKIMKKILISSCIVLYSLALAEERKYDGIKEDIESTPTCYTQHVFILEDHCGEFVNASSSDLWPGECAPGQGEGSVTVSYSVFRQPAPQEAHICNCSHG